MKAQFYSFLPRNIVRARHLREATKKAMQQDLDGAWREHACSSAAQPLQEEGFKLEACQGEVFYLGLECSFTLKVHKWTCKCCHQTIVPHALSFSCFPSSPEVEHLWYDLRVLQQYKRLGLGGGTSATGEVGLESALGLLLSIISSNDVKSIVTLTL